MVQKLNYFYTLWGSSSLRKKKVWEVRAVLATLGHMVPALSNSDRWYLISQTIPLMYKLGREASALCPLNLHTPPSWHSPTSASYFFSLSG